MNDIITKLAVLALAAFLASPVWAQQAEEAQEDEPAAESEADETLDEDIEVDDTSYIDIEEEDFIPSEEIGADQSIAFPTDI